MAAAATPALKGRAERAKPDESGWESKPSSVAERIAAWPEAARPVLLALAALLLRVPPWLAAYPLHRDEALYGYWARMIASGRDPLLLAAWVDKPPLVLYLLAGSVGVFGASPFALRLPGMAAGVLLPLLVYGFARRLGGVRLAFAAGLLTALSPFAVLFSPTAFTDPWLAVWLLAAAWAALAARPGWAGLCLGLAIASKQNGVLAAPLVLALLWYARRRAIWQTAPEMGDLPNRPARDMICFISACALPLGAVTWWDSLRWGTRPSFWTRSLDTYGGLGLAGPAQWPERGAAWATQLGYLFGPPVVTALVLAFAVLAASAALWRVAHHARVGSIRFIGFGVSGIDRVSLILGVYVLGYLAVHLFLTFQPWDRYLLPLVPLLAILAARGGVEAWEWVGERLDHEGTRGRLDHEGTKETEDAKHEEREGRAPALRVLRASRLRGAFAASWPKRLRGTFASSWSKPSWTKRTAGIARFTSAVLVAALLLWSSSLGVSARLPVGSDHWAYAGLDEVAARVGAMPWDAVVYERSLGWQLDFYFPGYPPARIWWDAAETLAEDAEYGVANYPNREQWVIVATAADGDVAAADRAGQALAARGLQMVERERILRPDGTCSFVIYQILPTASFGRGHEGAS